jgi:tetratricopeptide (TPR) repeat protein
MKDLKKGLQLDRESAEMNFVQAVSFYFLKRDYEKALSQLTELKRKVPNMADLYAFTSYVLRRQGKYEASLQELKYALKLDPLNENYYHNMFQTFDITHRYDSLIHYSEKAHSLIPDFNRCVYLKQHALLKKSGDYTLVSKESGLTDLCRALYTYMHDRKVDYTQMFKYRIAFKDIQNQYCCLPRQFQWAYLYYLKNDSINAAIYLDSAVDILRSKIVTEGDESSYYSTLGRCYAMQGNTTKAYEMGRRAVALQPIKLDAFLGVKRIEELMEIDIIAGKYDDALDKMEHLLSNPSWLSVGDLLLYKRYDKLRDHPRFRELVVKFVDG